VIPIPDQWMVLPRMRVAISVDGLPEHHDVRRKPATYERILENISGREVNIHWVITGQMMARPGYLEEYVAFWSRRPEVNRIWVSVYTPQIGEQSAETLTHTQCKQLGRELPPLRARYPKLFINERVTEAILRPPENPDECLFSKMSANYSADLRTRVEPCVFGGEPDCSQCGCAISVGLHSLRDVELVGPLKAGHLVEGSVRIGRFASRVLHGEAPPTRLYVRSSTDKSNTLVQIQS